MIARTGAAAAAIGNESGRGCLGCDNKFGRQLRKRWDRLTTAADDCLDSVGEASGWRACPAAAAELGRLRLGARDDTPPVAATTF
eukprot:scaffold182405_cov29-Tisochrysis_lutea.AAC.3